MTDGRHLARRRAARRRSSPGLETRGPPSVLRSVRLRAIRRREGLQYVVGYYCVLWAVVVMCLYVCVCVVLRLATCEMIRQRLKRTERAHYCQCTATTTGSTQSREGQREKREKDPRRERGGATGERRRERRRRGEERGGDRGGERGGEKRREGRRERGQEKKREKGRKEAREEERDERGWEKERERETERDARDQMRSPRHPRDRRCLRLPWVKISSSGKGVPGNGIQNEIVISQLFMLCNCAPTRLGQV